MCIIIPPWRLYQAHALDRFAVLVEEEGHGSHQKVWLWLVVCIKECDVVSLDFVKVVLETTGLVADSVRASPMHDIYARHGPKLHSFLDDVYALLIG